MPASRSRARPVRGALLALTLVLGADATSCSDEGAVEVAALSREAEQALEADDPSQALFLAKRALERHGERAELLRLAAAACNALDRHSDATAFAQRGLDVVGDDDVLQADLQFERGRASLGLYRELEQPADWSKADVLLAGASKQGTHRAEAAALVVVMQFLDGRNNLERARQYARIVAELDPGGRFDTLVDKVFAAQGVER